MMKSLIPDRPDLKLLVFRNGKIGNTLIAEPLARKLKEFHPEARVSMVVDGLGLGLLRTCPHVDRFFVFDRKKDGLGKQIRLARELRAEGFHASLHLRTGVRNELLALASGIPLRFGTKLKGSFQFLTHVQPKRPDMHVHEALGRFLSGIEGRDAGLDHPRLYPDPEGEAEVDAFAALNGLDKGYFVVHPGGQTAHGLAWSLLFFRDLAAYLNKALGMPAVVIGSADEKDEAASVFAATDARLAFDLPIQATSALIRRARAFAGNDSGPAHMAEAWKVPVFTAFRNDQANFAKWRPLNQARCLSLFENQLGESDVFERIGDFFGRTAREPEDR